MGGKTPDPENSIAEPWSFDERMHDEQQLAQAGLPVAPRYRSEEVGFLPKCQLLDVGSLKRARELEAFGFLQSTLAASGKITWTRGFVVTKQSPLPPSRPAPPDRNEVSLVSLGCQNGNPQAGQLRRKRDGVAPWTAADIPDLTGRAAVVTGANTGLGYETAKALALHGANVIMACRDESRGRAAAELLEKSAAGATVEPMRLDLADLECVRSFAAAFGDRYDALDILVNNAGVMAPPKRLTTKQGFELQFGTNHLGHFALTGLLLPQLLASDASRVVTVSSFAHESGRIVFDDLQRELRYAPYGAYSASKLANLLFMLELDRRLRRAEVSGPISVGAHPGFASTNLQATGPFLGSPKISSWFVLGGVRLFGQSAAQGAEPQLYAATAPCVEGGQYFGPKNRIRGHVAPSGMAPQARDEAVASRLWSVSKQLTGVDLDEAIAASPRSSHSS